MRRFLAIPVVVCALVAPATSMLPVSAQRVPVDDRPQAVTIDSTDSDATPGVYVVRLPDVALAAYRGDRPGYPATKPVHGRRFDASRPAVAAYRAFLLDRQDAVLDAIDNPTALYRYTTAINGFAAHLTSEQVKALRTNPDVAAVQRSETLHLTSARAPGRGAPMPHEQVRREGTALSRDAGDGVVVGVVDAGIWPENPSFAGVPIDAVTRKRTYPGFSGGCQSGERWGQELCDAKVLAARYFVRGFGADKLAANEYLSARDTTGHGSHIAAIAAGNPGVAVTIDGQSFGRISGVAPGAGLAVYKACWTAPDPEDDGCSLADTVAAIDRAVSDGVDVLSYSISGAEDAKDVISHAFLNASQAGIFVSTAAGDDGPRKGSVDHTSPWVTTVAASIHDLYRGRLRLGDGTVIDGAMVSSESVPGTRLVRGADAAADGVASHDAALCLPGSLDSTVVEGAILICDRGVSSRLDKGRVAVRAGASALVLANTTAHDLPADIQPLPALHITAGDRREVMAYLERADRPSAGLRSIEPTSTTQPRVARFGSRGPVSSAGGDILKPDLAAPGVNVLSAVAPSPSLPRDWNLMSGTSMAAPYVAGLAALIAERHPDWSVAATKSALVTTSQPVVGSPLARGAGVAGPAALDPGLVYDTSADDWRRFAVDRLDGRQLNQPTIAIGTLVGTETVTRTVTNVSAHQETFDATLTGLRGLSASVTPTRVRLAPGESAQVEIGFSAKRGARYGDFSGGALVWTGSRGHSVTSPVVVRPEFLAAPPDVERDVSAGGAAFRARAGVTGTVRVRAVGPVAATPTPFTLEPGDFDPAAPDIDSSSTMRVFFVPPRTSVARFQIDAANPTDDIDLYVYRGGRLVATATSSAADELITLEAPRPGIYRVFLSSAASGSDATTSGRFTGWVIHRDAPRRMQVSPARIPVTGGRSFGIDTTWQRLDNERAWLGYLSYVGTGSRTYLTLH